VIDSDVLESVRKFTRHVRGMEEMKIVEISTEKKEKLFVVQSFKDNNKTESIV
jgi:hypothetical protein